MAQKIQNPLPDNEGLTPTSGRFFITRTVLESGRGCAQLLLAARKGSVRDLWVFGPSP